MDDYISRKAALSHPFANGQYDHEHADEQFIIGYESYREWLEQIPAADVRPVVMSEDCPTCRYYNLEQGDTLYRWSDWDGGIGFDYIHNIRFCPVCGRELTKEG